MFVPNSNVHSSQPLQPIRNFLVHSVTERVISGAEGASRGRVVETGGNHIESTTDGEIATAPHDMTSVLHR